MSGYKIKPQFRNESHFTDSIRKAARVFGWRTYHTRFSKGSEPGFPDLVVTKRGKLIFAELKTERGKLTDPQREWLKSLEESGQDVFVWRPSDWDTILELLQK